MPTPFEVFLSSKRQGGSAAGEGDAPSKPPAPEAPQSSGKPGASPQRRPHAPAASTELPPGLLAQRSALRQEPVRHSAPELRAQVVASLPAAKGAGSAAAAAAAGAVTPASAAGAAPAPGAKGDTVTVYGELAAAAASLATAAHKLACGSDADRTVAASYESLAKAATDLASSACLIRPLAVPAHAPVAAKAQQALPPLPLPRSGSVPPLPVAVDPTAAAANASASARIGGGGGGSRAGRSTGRSHSVALPRFPGYNPLVHVMQSDLPLPGTPGAKRAVTSSPITHELNEVRPLRTGAGSTAGSSRLAAGSPQRLLTHRSGSAALPPVLQPSDLLRLPVLSLSADHAAERFSVGAAGGEVRNREQLLLDGGSGSKGLPPVAGAQPAGDGAQLVDLYTFLDPYTDVHLAEWPPPEPITVQDMVQDELDRRYNKVLEALRERLYARGHGLMAAAFRSADRQGNGMLSQAEFVNVLQGMNLGAGLVDERVVDLMLNTLKAAVEARGGSSADPSSMDQRVSYSEFVNAIRFGALPWRGYNPKLRHRVGGDPDCPFGLPACPGPFGVASPDASKAPASAPSKGGDGLPTDGAVPEAEAESREQQPLKQQPVGAAASAAGGEQGSAALLNRAAPELSETHADAAALLQRLSKQVGGAKSAAKA